LEEFLLDPAIDALKKNHTLEQVFVKTSAVMAVCAAGIGLLALLGWIFNIAILKTNGAGYVTIKANTAIALALAGAALFLLNNGNARSIKYRAGLALAGMTALIGLLTLMEHAFNLQLGIDELFFRGSDYTAGTVHAGRMAPNTAVNFILLGVSLMLIDARGGMLFSLGRLCACGAGLIAFFALAGYSYGVTAFYGFESYTKMALYTAAAFLALFIGALIARPGRGITAYMAADNPGGLMLRYSIPAVIVVLFILSWLRIAGEKAGLYDSYFGTSLFTIIRIVVLLAMAFLVAGYVNRLCDARQEKEKDLQACANDLKSVKEVNKLKSQFIAIISHELRTPLTIIKGFSTFLGRGASGALNAQQADFVGVIEHNVGRLSHIVNEMTDISRIESGVMPIEKQPNVLRSILDTCVKEIGYIAAKSSVSLEFEEGGPKNLIMYVDRPKLEQVFINLLNNAIKFSKTGGKVYIAFKYPYTGLLPAGMQPKLGAGASHVLISVRDEGDGVEEKNLGKIFERFFQEEDHATRRFQGMGLGLFIAKNIVTSHGGHIWCESEGKGKGAVFNVLLPDREDSGISTAHAS
jgi:two-component system, sensor histidine kinase and response regulator